MALLTSENPELNNSAHSTGTSSEDDGVSTETVLKKSVFRRLTQDITIEPLMFLHMVGITCYSVILQNFYLDRICTVTYNHTENVCGNLTLDSEHDYELQVEKTASKYAIYRSLIEAGFPILFSIFLGPWSDKHGTKFPMLLPLFGYAVSAGTYALMTFFPDLPPAYLLIGSIPIAISGGMVALVLSAFSFMANLTNIDNRSKRIALLEATWFLGGPVGIYIGAQIYKIEGYAAVFCISGALFALALLYGIIFVREDKPDIPLEERSNCCTDMFNVEAVKDVFATIFVKRRGSYRKWILILIVTICLRILTMFGVININYLYVRNKFHWDAVEYSKYTTADSLIGVTGGFFMIWLTMMVLKLQDTVIGIFSSIGYCTAALVFAFASSGWMMYLGAVIQMFSGLITIVIRSMLSKCVAKEELARVFTFLSCGEAAMPIFAGPLYSILYLKTASVLPGAVFLVSAGINFIILLSFVYFFLCMRNHTSHSQLEEDDPAEVERRTSIS